MTMRLVLSLSLMALTLSLFVGCEALVASAEQSLQGTAAPLKEADLPNTSRMLNCCANLTNRSETKSFVESTCATITPQIGIVIAKYQQGKKTIQDDTVLNAQAKTDSLNQLKKTSQETLEPAARCLLQETIGKISLNGFLSPADCEAMTSTGALPVGKQCSDVTDAILKAE
jgi:hypothetical protein